MRNFEERMEEIQRRSEKIIKQRKKRRLLIAATCVPMLLCITVLSVFVLPEMMPVNTMEPGIYNEADTENYQYTNHGVSFVQVSGSKTSHTVTDSETVSRILQFLSPAVEPETNVPEQQEATKDMLEVSQEMAMDNMKDFSDSSNTSVLVYTITLHTDNGITERYRLVGNRLESDDNSEIRILTQKERYELMSLLGLQKGA